VLRLAAATSNDVGSVFTNTALNVATGFSTSFNFRLTSRGGSSDGTAIGADGIVFAVQRVGPAALGATGEGLGYLNIGSSVGIEFDTYQNSNRNDPSSNHVGVNLGGSVTSAVTANVSPDFDSVANNGAKWTAWVDYNGSLLEVRVAQNGIRPATALLSHALNLATTIGGDTAYVGFTAATGGALANHDLLSWAFSDSFLANGLTMYTWSGSGVWSETARWNPGAIPGGSDIALVSAGAATVGDARTIRALQLSGGTITGGGTLTLAGTGSTWSGGTLGGTGTLRIATGGLLEVVGSVDHVFSRADGNTTGGRTIENAGTVRWSGGNLLGGDGSTFINTASGLLVITGAGTFGHNLSGVSPSLTNAGILEKTSGAGGPTDIQVRFDSTGTIKASAGTLKLSGGGSSNNTVTIGNGAKLQIAGNDFAFTGGAINGSTGKLDLSDKITTFSNATSGDAEVSVSGATATAKFDGNHTGTGKLTLANGIVSGSGTADFATVEWTGGALNARVKSTGATAISGGAKSLAGELTLAGNTGWDGSPINASGAAKIKNETGRTFSANADGLIANSGTAVFTNTGTFEKTAGLGGVNATEVRARFESTGEIKATGGNLKLSGGGNSSNTVTIGNGAKLQIESGNFDFTGGALNSTATGALEISGAIATFGGTTGSANLAVNGTGTAKINGSHSTSGKLTLSGTGKLDGVNAASTATVGSLAWDGGDITTAVVASAGTTIGTGAAKKLYLGAQLNLSGATQWTADSIGTGGGAQIKNSGAFTTSFDGTVAHDQGGGRATFKNDGAFTKSNATTGITEIQAVFESTAVTSSVNVDAGTLKLSGGGSSNKPVNLGGSAKLQIAGNNYTFGGGALNTTGTGEIEITGATAAFSGTSGSANLRVSTGGTAQFDGNHAGSGKLTLSAGTVSGTGTATVGALEWTGGSVNAKVRSTGNASITGTAKTIGSLGELTLAGTANTVTAELTNQGKFAKDGASTTDLTARFTNSGTVNVNTGTLRFSGAASNAAHSAVIVAAGAQLEIANDAVLAANSELKGNGLARFVGGILDANGVVGIQNFDFNNGQLLGTNLFSGNLNWNGGNWNASAPGPTTTIDTSAVLNLRSSTGHNEFNFRNILNKGTVNWSSGTIRGGNGSTFVNVNRFNDLNTGANTIENPTAFGGTFTFTNNGRYEKTGAGTTTFAAEFTNNGALVVTAGEVVFSGLFTNNGRIQLGNGASAQFASPLTFAANAPLTGTGTINAPSVTAAGVVSPGVSPGKLALTGDLTLLGTSEILVELAGTNKGVTYDFLDVGGTATLGSIANGYATLKVTFLDGYQSTVNETNTFTVLTAAGGLNQTFANVSNGQRLFTIDGFGSFQVNYGVGSAFAANSVVLSNFAAMPIPEPSTWALLVTGLGIVAFFARRRR
jgi:hypothetical protein